MTDELTPQQEADISRLLAEARHVEPIPSEVAARLDAVLGDLSADDLEVFEVATVTNLEGARRRRRNAGRLLLAAAAVVVGGVAVGQTIDGAGDTSPSADSAQGGGDDLAEAPRDADGSSVDEEVAPGAAGAETDSGETGEAPASALNDVTALLEYGSGAALRFTSDNFSAEAEQQLTPATRARREAAFADFDAVETYAATTLFTCPDADYGAGARLPAYYDEQEAVLVLRRPVAGVQRADLLECGSAAPLESVDLPAR